MIHRLLQPSSGHENIQAIPKGFGINKDTAAWLCPWAVAHAPSEGTLFAEPVGRFGRGPSWSGHQSHKVLLRALGSVPSILFLQQLPPGLNQQGHLTPQPSHTCAAQSSGGFCFADWLLKECGGQVTRGLLDAILWGASKKGYGERFVSWRGNSGEGTLAEPGFEQNMSEFFLTLSPMGTDKLGPTVMGLGPQQERTRSRQSQEGKWVQSARGSARGLLSEFGRGSHVGARLEASVLFSAFFSPARWVCMKL